MADPSMMDWTGLLGAGGVTGLGYGGYALWLADQRCKNYEARLAAQDESHKRQVDTLHQSYQTLLKEKGDAHDRDLREATERERNVRTEIQALLERVLEKVGELAVFRAGRSAGSGGGAVPGPGNGGGGK